MTIRRTIPTGWKWVELREICHINPRKPKHMPYALNTPTSFVPMASVSQDTGSIVELQLRPLREVIKGYTYFEEDDVLFAKITPCMQNGKHAIARNLNNGFGFGTTEFHVIRPLDSIIPEWVHLYVRSPKVLGMAASHFRGAVGQQRVPKEFLSDLEIPLPSVSEQKRIAAALNEQMASVAKAKRAAQEEMALLNAMRPALLRRAFSGAL